MNGFSLLQGQHKLAGQAWELPAWNLIDIVGWNYFLVIPESEGVNYRQYGYSNFHLFFFNTWQRFFLKQLHTYTSNFSTRKKFGKSTPKIAVWNAHSWKNCWLGSKIPKRQLNIRVVEVRKCLTSLKIMNHGKIEKTKKNYDQYFL